MSQTFSLGTTYALSVHSGLVCILLLRICARAALAGKVSGFHLAKISCLEVQ